ncbi:DUF1905 domain-containing protein [Modestobacter marinus]|uniref:DUF1905 domain-containing protein n=1 Tax=Modestobacter marinus TaxID=477641 RepID=UPI001C93B97A|nr:DUF1905 domain-containing protein [Modestobacter marinus]
MTRPARRERQVGHAGRVDLEFGGDVWHWRGPAPFHVVTVPEEESSQLHELSRSVTYGWGMIPVRARIGGARWTTSLFREDGRCVVPRS